MKDQEARLAEFKATAAERYFFAQPVKEEFVPETQASRERWAHDREQDKHREPMRPKLTTYNWKRRGREHGLSIPSRRQRGARLATPRVRVRSRSFRSRRPSCARSSSRSGDSGSGEPGEGELAAPAAPLIGGVA